jgi:carbonic anhydrase/acetyltransferase-like protein (isoleucine patch superfamily)
MQNDIKISTGSRVGTGFVPAQFLLPGEDEYRIRNEQLRMQGKDPDAYRALQPFELEALVRNHNTCNDWSLFRVTDPFTPELVHNSVFSGLIRIGKLERVALEHHDLQVYAGIADSQVIACDIGDNCVINDCSYLAHYIVGDTCILLQNAEIHVSNHAKFGNGIIMESEDEDVRIHIDVMNESGARYIYPFNGMNCADAYLWAKYRDLPELMESFSRMTDAMFDRRLGRYGEIGKASVLKSNRVIKDVFIGESAYIKGSNKLKNLSINSSEDARTQIGEGVELVNGIIGYGCKIFYGCKAVRFVMGDNSALKYGARLIHSVLGENSTLSCCEILNNLVFPAHEQHHNTSFLIASLVKGQSNMAAGATIGSNHNSRSPDGEIEAGRGFWPSLCTSVKHSSRFTSFCLLAKGDYRYELDIPLPFTLVDNDYARDRLILSPAFWWIHNLYALMRNESKFQARDNRRDKSIRFEYSPFAPDSASEILKALELLEEWTGCSSLGRDETMETSKIRTLGRRYLAESDDPLPFEVFAANVEHSSRTVVVHKPARAWNAYREMLLWFAGVSVLEHLKALPSDSLDFDRVSSNLEKVSDVHIDSEWVNIGGALVTGERLGKMLTEVSEGKYATWLDLHSEYRRISEEYPAAKTKFAWLVLKFLYGKGDTREGPLERNEFLDALRDLSLLSERVERGVFESRVKDWKNPFRKATFRNEAEMLAVHGKCEENPFIEKIHREMNELRGQLSHYRTVFSSKSESTL